MKRFSSQKITASCLALTFLYSIISMPLAEASFWEERQKAVKGINHQSNLASLPAQFALPPISTIQQTPQHMPNSPMGFSPKGLPGWLHKLPLQYVHLDEYHYPAGLAKDQLPSVIVLKDLHAQTQAQQNIADFITTLGHNHPSLVVGVEGAVGDLDFSPYRTIAGSDTIEKLAKAFMTRDWIQGPEYAGLTGPEHIHYTGIEDKDLYIGNINAYKSAVPLKEEFLKNLKSAAHTLQTLKQTHYTKDQKQIDQLFQNFQNHGVDIRGYVQGLIKASNLKERISHFKNTQVFLNAAEKEDKMDLKKAEQERTAIIKDLTAVLPKQILEQWVQKTLHYRVSQIDHADYYQYILSLVSQANVPVAKYPHFKFYADYVRLVGRIDRHSFFNELIQIEEFVWNALKPNPVQKDLRQLTQHATLIQKLAEQSLTDQEWETYQKRRGSIHEFERKVYKRNWPAKKAWQTKLARQGGMADEIGSLRSRDLLSKASPQKTHDQSRPDFSASLKIFESFYTHATSRNKALVNNLLDCFTSNLVHHAFLVDQFREQSEPISSAMPFWRANFTPKQPLAVLVAGGFHATGIKSLLKQKNISYAVFSPQISEIDKSKNALEALTKGPTPLDRLVLGDKIFLATPVNVGIKTPLTKAGTHPGTGPALLISAPVVEAALKNSAEVKYLLGQQNLVLDSAECLELEKQAHGTEFLATVRIKMGSSTETVEVKVKQVPSSEEVQACPKETLFPGPNQKPVVFDHDNKTFTLEILSEKGNLFKGLMTAVIHIGPAISAAITSSPDQPKSIDRLLKEFNDRRKGELPKVEELVFVVEQEILDACGLNDPSFYNIAGFEAQIDGIMQEVIAARVENKDKEDELAYTMFFTRADDGRYVRVRNTPVIENLQDPFASYINGTLIVGGVQMKWKDENNPRYGGWEYFKTVFYEFPDGLQLHDVGRNVELTPDIIQKIVKKQKDLNPSYEGPEKMKDIRLFDLGGDKGILVLTRPSHDPKLHGRGNIHYTIIKNLSELNDESILAAEPIKGVDGERIWPLMEYGGPNQIWHLPEEDPDGKEGWVGVLGHIAKGRKIATRFFSRNLLYCPFIFKFNPETGEFKDVRVISRRDKKLLKERKIKDLQKDKGLFKVQFPQSFLLDKSQRIKFNSGYTHLYMGEGDIFGSKAYITRDEFAAEPSVEALDERMYHRLAVLTSAQFVPSRKHQVLGRAVLYALLGLVFTACGVGVYLEALDSYVAAVLALSALVGGMAAFSSSQKKDPSFVSVREIIEDFEKSLESRENIEINISGQDDIESNITIKWKNKGIWEEVSFQTDLSDRLESVNRIYINLPPGFHNQFIESIQKLAPELSKVNELLRGRQKRERTEFRTLEFEVGDDILKKHKIVQPTFYNPTPPFYAEIDGVRKLVLGVRVEGLNSEMAYAMFFEYSKNGVCRHIKDTPVLHNHQDPFLSVINGRLIIGGVELTNPRTVDNAFVYDNFRTVFYEFGSDLKTHTKIGEGPLGMKDIRLFELREGENAGKILVLTRPNTPKQEYGMGEIRYTIINNLEDLKPEIITSAYTIEKRLCPMFEWVGSNQIYRLSEDDEDGKKGWVGVVGHMAMGKKDKGEKDERDLNYFPITFKFNPVTGDYKVNGKDLRIILARFDMDGTPDSEKIIDFYKRFSRGEEISEKDFRFAAKRPGLWNVLFSAGFLLDENQRIVFEDEHALFFTGVGDVLVREAYIPADELSASAKKPTPKKVSSKPVRIHEDVFISPALPVAGRLGVFHAQSEILKVSPEDIPSLQKEDVDSREHVSNIITLLNSEPMKPLLEKFEISIITDDDIINNVRLIDSLKSGKAKPLFQFVALLRDAAEAGLDQQEVHRLIVQYLFSKLVTENLMSEQEVVHTNQQALAGDVFDYTINDQSDYKAIVTDIVDKIIFMRRGEKRKMPNVLLLNDSKKINNVVMRHLGALLYQFVDASKITSDEYRSIMDHWQIIQAPIIGDKIDPNVVYGFVGNQKKRWNLSDNFKMWIVNFVGDKVVTPWGEIPDELKNYVQTLHMLMPGIGAVLDSIEDETFKARLADIMA